MFKDRRYQEIAGIAIMLLAVILFLSLITYKITDSARFNGDLVGNIAGPIGAGISHTLRSALGISSYFIVIIVGFAGWVTLRAGNPLDSLERAFSLFFLSITSASLAGFISPEIPQASGGYAGCGIAYFLTHIAGTVGAALIIIILNVAGLILLGVFSLASLVGVGEKIINIKRIRPMDFSFIKNIISKKNTDVPLNSISENIAKTAKKRSPWITKETILVDKHGIRVNPKGSRKILELPILPKSFMPEEAADDEEIIDALPIEEAGEFFELSMEEMYTSDFAEQDIEKQVFDAAERFIESEEVYGTDEADEEYEDGAFGADSAASLYEPAARLPMAEKNEANSPPPSPKHNRIFSIDFSIDNDSPAANYTESRYATQSSAETSVLLEEPAAETERQIGTSAEYLPETDNTECDRTKIDMANTVKRVFSEIVFRKKYSIPTSFLQLSKPVDVESWKNEVSKNSQLLVNTLSEFGIESSVIGVHRGPVITLYELQIAPGIKVNRIVGLSDDIAMALAASRVRVVAPIPGKSAVGIEIPNAIREEVMLGDIINTHEYKTRTGFLKVALGKDILGKPLTLDLKRLPHLLIAGATGSGKSVCVNTIITSLVYSYDPNYLRFIMVDPKMVELQIYNGLPHLLTPVITEPLMTPAVLKWAIYEMERRYRLLSSLNTRDIERYNEKLKEIGDGREKLPYIVIIIDELADLMMSASKEIEGYITRLAQKARAIGIHLVLATQRPSVDVITGIIKANFPARIAFQVAQKTDSRTIIDQNGAEKLLGQGDMLYQSPMSSFPVRIQGAFISEDE
ncbi:MAG: DNA translocase FtsK, partial [Leptospirales bacterium]|nr:DNA translocase FtsK [Leptospirales bacterium]